jgi:hypothetical protein
MVKSYLGLAERGKMNPGRKKLGAAQKKSRLGSGYSFIMVPKTGLEPV